MGSHACLVGQGGHISFRRVKECWVVLRVAGVDKEGGGTVFQMSLVGSVGIVSFCFVGGFWPQEMTSLWLEFKHVIV